MALDVLSILTSIDELAKVPEAQLQWLIDHSEQSNLAPGDYVFKKGDPADHMWILLEGVIHVNFTQNNQTKRVGTFKQGTISGVLPYSRLKQANGNGEVAEPTIIMRTHRDHFPAMIKTQHELVEALVHLMTTRVRNFTAMQQQNEKLMSLGKLSAGLAHELNNPASAIARSATALKEHLQALPDDFKKVMSVKITPKEVDTVNDFMFEKINSRDLGNLSLMEKTELEDEIADWLEDNGVEDGFEMAGSLVEFDFSVDDLEHIQDQVGEDHFYPVLKWIRNNLTTEKMVEEIQDASIRIADLVKSVKSYTHMDQSHDKQAVNVHEGIRNTVRMLEHKFRKSQVQLVENFDDDLPEIMAFPGELNQVWTNIIDNAIDALQSTENSTLTIDTLKDGDFVKVTISDNGPGIPDDVVHKIFDPFFTTKALGEGTGLGLDIVHKIITQHNADIKVHSEPGKTDFVLCFPIDN